jgi:hypothetical protein
MFRKTLGLAMLAIGLSTAAFVYALDGPTAPAPQPPQIPLPQCCGTPPPCPPACQQ